MNDVQTMLKELMAQGFTLVTVAERLGVSVNTVRKWSAGMRYPANAHLVKAALAGLKGQGPKLTYPQKIARLRKHMGSARHLAGDRSMVDELLEDRRREAEKERKEIEYYAPIIDRKFPRGPRYD